MGRREDDSAGGWGAGAHPLLAASADLHRALDGAHGVVAAETDPAWLPARDQAVLLEQLGRARQRLDALLIATLAATSGADGVTSLDASRSPADWLARRLCVKPGRLVSDQKLGGALAGRPVLAAALAAGEVTVEHARAVVEVLAALPTDDLEPSVLERAEQLLVGHCGEFTPPEVRRLGRHLLDVVAPDVAEAIEAKRLADQEREARRATTLRLQRTGRGTRRLVAEIPELHATILETALRAYTNPRQDAPDVPADDGRRLTDSQRLGHAFCALVEHLPTAGLPTHGGTPVTVMVAISEQRLRRDTAQAGLAGLGMLETGVEISPGELRRLACHHGILPAVLDGAGQVLDLGRTQRFFSRAQHTALRIMHPACQAQGCTVPAAWCEAHHRQPWSTGGRTDLADGALLCPHHHHRAHDPDYEATWHPDGAVTFHRRC